MSKKCTRCNKVKPLDKFKKYRHKGKDRVCSRCISCSNEAASQWRKDNPDRASLSHAKSQLKLTYGLTFEQYETILEAQNGVCAICHKSETEVSRKNGKIKRLSVDHDHSFQFGDVRGVRGLLCQRCNHLLGQAKEDIEILRAAIRYLENTTNGRKVQ